LKEIIVFGINRSGTKFLTNLIAASFDFSCIQSNEHGGVIESNIHSYYANNFPGNLTVEEKETILKSFITEYTFTKSNLSLLDLNNIKWNCCIDFFYKFYHSNVVKSNKNGWVQKASSIYLDHFNSDSIIKIIAQRNSLEVLNSSIRAFKLNFIQSLRNLFSINLMHKYEKKYANKNSILLLTYESIIANRKIILEQISEFIDSNCLDIKENIEFNNSSFKNGKKKRKHFVYTLADIFFKTIIFFIPISYINNRVKKNGKRKIYNLVSNSIDPDVV